MQAKARHNGVQRLPAVRGIETLFQFGARWDGDFGACLFDPGTVGIVAHGLLRPGGPPARLVPSVVTAPEATTSPAPPRDAQKPTEGIPLTPGPPWSEQPERNTVASSA